ncbi:SGNH/GDSL hydrolase family protein [Kineosporia sp. NBRC 101731]|uniref:SGNH/GDSL hydrolase family protein n=1 Tax=Kineosporia sp. NBRC 101731 TaxID=3032199 RepID=UPI0024A485D4|nr:SGNH/GDSL hydrolase family protein [Kineosporia sp. NBRC 101731]GLY33642.1 hypothetical protein Kisp02_70070 [Kineosporia sp. NBRC 101731]
MNGIGYDNLSGRPPGALLTALTRMSRRVRSVQDQVVPFARAWGERNARELAQGTGPLWVALGDSMTQGIGAPAPELGYIGQPAADRPDFRLLNLSFSGARTHDVIGRQWPAALEVARAHDLPIGLVTLLIGSNDLLRADFRAALRTDFPRLLDLLPPGSVVGTLPNPRPAAHRLNAAVDAAACAGRVRVAELRHTGTGWAWRGRLAPDLFRPNEHGYAVLAGAFARAIRGLPGP